MIDKSNLPPLSRIREGGYFSALKHPKFDFTNILDNKTQTKNVLRAQVVEIEDLNRNSAELLVEKLREDNFFATVLDDQATELAQLQTAEDIINADGALETDPLLHEEMAYYSGLPEVWEEASQWSYQSAKESKEIADKQKSEAVKKIQKIGAHHENEAFEGIDKPIAPTLPNQ